MTSFSDRPQRSIGFRAVGSASQQSDRLHNSRSASQQSIAHSSRPQKLFFEVIRLKRSPGQIFKLVVPHQVLS
ncbi:hypothetical protein [Microcoleus sp. F4-D5]|uniref:hypothetical protein n=1 Tax=Microcoleus sp. F4-D5 TaxID=2818760 RepID=UPI002FCE8D93